MAEHLASIFGTEKDRVNCPFYFKIGVCRHGDRCSRLHNRPTASQTLLLANMYQSPDAGFHGGVDQHGNIQQSDPRKLQEHFEDFYEDIFEELSKYGEIENLNVCDNLADHMIGNVYVKFREEEHAAAALNALSGRFYAGRPIILDFSPVTDFREATCRQYEENTCNRGGYCNFMHLKKISRELRRKLFGNYRRRSRSRSHSPYGRGEARGPPSPRRYGDRDFYEPRRGRGGGRGRGYGRRYEEWDDRRYDDRRGGGRSDGRRRDRSRSRTPPRRGRSPAGGREGSAERRAKIEQWNREREERQAAENAPVGSPPRRDAGSPPRRESAAYDNE
ncbi:hypothetical protein M758_5G177100 [Ceratodon purpureus]|uniref:Uncharacterized protein n=1 Tax=Ceratodon purpureus TaxID=3225 RepID=A0A8T0I401_CERPU|nr:hypothetical protein KC19_5G184300 [Ceratodon purpureus]KAG0577817.1 hypothetical protein KC19_5G184300 [Ceratodon purpureus]KAG0577818.1 hypothetical protein KC19_5G184300 [Ceratodon purpureus]KAG0617257.1 hypothetical protein M758_5G177100 [Ceratodon purpureus]KAG0617258.1 hypothetical protein M758_5G177100 [Ceratodon purpureus]